MKHVLVISKHNSLRGLLAKAYLEKYRKCAASVYSIGNTPKPPHPALAVLLSAHGIDFALPGPLPLPEKNFDYVITVCDEARKSLPPLSGSPLYFHYHFEEAPGEQATEQALTELRDTMKQYFERFCKMYLSEFA